MPKKLTLLDVKAALKDQRFRDLIPEELKPDLIKYMDNPHCSCNVPFYRKIITNCKEQLLKYYPGAEIPNLAEETRKMAENHWTVINCHINDLESKLKSLPPGRKQVELSRFEDQVTVIINELDIIF
jgi:hypothetical protein